MFSNSCFCNSNLLKTFRLTIFIIFLPLLIWAQNNKADFDSVRVKGKTFFILPDTSIYVNNDTIFYLPDSIVASFNEDREARTSEFYKALRDKLSKRRVTKEIYSLLFKDLNKPVNLQAIQGPTDNFENFEGRVISDIYIKRLQPFGTSITDTARYTKSWSGRMGNKLHSLTREKVVRNNLLIDVGDEIDAEVLRDVERVLRRLPFLRDARVYIIPKKETSQVDVLIITRDVWSITGSASYNDPQNFEFSITDRNFLGLGYEIENEFPYSTDAKPNLGYLGTYTANNIKSTFISTELTLARSAPFDRRGVRVFREFITPEIKYAGAVEVAIERREQSRIFTDTTITFNVKSRKQDYWFGRSFIIDDAGDSRTNLQFGIGYNDTDFLERPVIRADTNQVFYDRYTYLFSMGIAKRSFERSSLILGYGRTEDIPLGYQLEFTLGRETNQYTNRTYFGTLFSFANYFDRIGYIRPTLRFGSFIENRGWEQGVVNIEFSYFSFLYRKNRTNLRQFINVNYTNGINRYDTEFVNINDENGVRGLSETFLRGTDKISLNMETVAFTPFYFGGFRMAVYTFLDFAIINNRAKNLFDNQLYQGYGLGFRFRNENLAFNTIEVRLGWYPKTPAEVSSFGFNFSGSQSLNIPGFRLDEPQILPYQ